MTAEPESEAGNAVQAAVLVNDVNSSEQRSTLQRFERRVTELVLRGDVEAVERSVASYTGILGLRRRKTRECW